MKVQQELLRHSDIRTTMNIYTHMARSFEWFCPNRKHHQVARQNEGAIGGQP